MASNTKTVRVYSNSPSVSHKPFGTTFYWLWEQNPYEDECYLDLEKKELEDEMRRSIGFRRMFERGILNVKEPDILKRFRLDDTDEYIMNNKQLQEFINNSTVDEFEEFLQYAPQAMLDNIEVVCTSNELTDRNKIKLIKKYTGKDLEEFYNDKAIDEEKDGKPVEVETKKGRQPRKPVIK